LSRQPNRAQLEILAEKEALVIIKPRKQRIGEDPSEYSIDL